jgi:corrinoid protein of di/trimethylamine methyltransferase
MSERSRTSDLPFDADCVSEHRRTFLRQAASAALGAVGALTAGCEDRSQQIRTDPSPKPRGDEPPQVKGPEQLQSGQDKPRPQPKHSPSGLYDAILQGNAKKAEEATKAALAAGVDPSELIQKYTIPAMHEVGKRFERNEYFVPELLIAARAMKTSLAIITPHLVKTGARPAGRVVIGTVQGDLHDIGKSLVASMLEGGGFQVIDLGVDVSPQEFVESAREKDGTIVALSALLTTTMTQMKTVIEALKQAGIRDTTKVIVGGAPITQEYANRIGADGFSDNASGAVALAKRLVRASR